MGDCSSELLIKTGSTNRFHWQQASFQNDNLDLSRCIIARIGYNDKFDRMAKVSINLSKYKGFLEIQTLLDTCM